MKRKKVRRIRKSERNEMFYHQILYWTSLNSEWISNNVTRTKKLYSICELKISWVNYVWSKMIKLPSSHSHSFSFFQHNLDIFHTEGTYNLIIQLFEKRVNRKRVRWIFLFFSNIIFRSRDEKAWTNMLEKTNTELSSLDIDIICNACCINLIWMLFSWMKFYGSLVFVYFCLNTKCTIFVV